MKTYQIGDVFFSYESKEYEIKQSTRMGKFEVNTGADGSDNDRILYELAWKDLEWLREISPVLKNSIYELYEYEREHILIYHWETCRFAFGFFVSDIENKNKIPCYLNPKMKKLSPLNVVKLFTSAGIHSKFLQKEGFVFHASYLEWKRKAILFAGPSGTGKSTQADLWEKYTDARIINGDRVLIRKKDNVWRAYGYPACGSSNISKNETYPIEMIVLLEQADDNRVCQLSEVEMFRTIITGCEIHLWNQKEVNRALKIAETFKSEVPVIKLKCRPEKDAVVVLKKYLEEQ